MIIEWRPGLLLFFLNSLIDNIELEATYFFGKSFLVPMCYFRLHNIFLLFKAVLVDDDLADFEVNSGLQRNCVPWDARIEFKDYLLVIQLCNDILFLE